MKTNFLILLAASLTASVTLFAQERKDKAAVTYEELYDEPYSVNKLFVAFQPLYGELFVANVNAGFGFEASYYHKDKADFRAHFRKTYSRQFFDLSRDLAMNNSSVDNRAEVFNYFEIGGTYHIKDFEESSKTKMFLYKKSYRGDRWASRVPLSAEVPCKVRKIYGARLGGILWDSSTDLNRAMEEQSVGYDKLKSGDASLPAQEFNKNGELKDVNVFTNISSKGLYIGGSLSWIKNVAVNFDKFEEGIDDLMFTTYFDILFSPSIHVDDVVYTPKDITGSPIITSTAIYSVDAIKTKSIGFRAGIEGKFNRTLSWSYGGEIGYRPGIEGRTFFALLKISFPVYGTNLDYKVESFGK
ncbi:hypothetical protein [Chryseosolibacter indicus]|uniref:DUF4421 domain-containing protein n=1 Tax=Chryseosolibacter indicus TaxID=2782351 RepID=A0ABS5VU47_9BACT|nr:hypothetical protein [Chryseosolibacter indicus]MBT1704949.1 hypothetical protein [Chryseosolibacter indicus]